MAMMDCLIPSSCFDFSLIRVTATILSLIVLLSVAKLLHVAEISSCSFLSNVCTSCTILTHSFDFAKILSATCLIVSTPSALCSASFLISLATTANPLPDCPARAASIDAFNASRLVCPVISIIRLTASLIDRIAWFVSSI